MSSSSHIVKILLKTLFFFHDLMWSLFFIVIIVFVFAVIIIFNYRNVLLNTNENFLKGKVEIVLKFSCPDGDF